MSRAGFRKQTFLDTAPTPHPPRLQQTLADPGSSPVLMSQGHLHFLEGCFPQLANKEVRLIMNTLFYC